MERRWTGAVSSNTYPAVCTLVRERVVRSSAQRVARWAAFDIILLVVAWACAGGVSDQMHPDAALAVYGGGVVYVVLALFAVLGWITHFVS